MHLFILRMRNNGIARTGGSINRVSLKLILVTVSCISVFLTDSQVLHAQQGAGRPEVGVALSGGGAHGIAHVGLLKVMEEAGLRPDYITGVSMGSIVGGMYSLGYPADSLEKILKSIDWNLLIGNKIPENRIIFQEKKYFYNSIISLPVSFRKVQLPSGMINGQQMENMLSYFSWPAADINDFSQLPVPFLCLGSDIVSGTRVSLKSGYLPDALRASSAVPSIFTPFRLDTLLLIDGGYFRNIAVTEIKEMGADIVIGSYTGFYPLSDEELQSVDGLVKQMGMITSYKDFEEQKRLIDILVEPDVKDQSITDFSNVDTLVMRGYRAALPYKDRFRRLADSLDAIGLQKPPENLMDKQYYVFDRIEVTGNRINTDAQIRGVLGIKPGEEVDKTRITEAIELLYGKAWFEKVRYTVMPAADSLILRIECIERPRAMLYGSLHYDNTLESGLLLSFSGKNLITRKSVITFDSFLGNNYRMRVNAIQFVDRNEKYGISFDYFTDRTLLPMIRIEDDAGKMINRNYYGSVSLNSRIGLNHMMKLSGEIENLNLIPDFITDQGLIRLTYNYLTFGFEYNANTLDSKHFPDKGTTYSVGISTSKLLSGSLRTVSLTDTYTSDDPGSFSFERFNTLRGSFRKYVSLSRKTTLSFRGEALYITNADSIKAQDSFYLLGGTDAVTRRSIAMTGFHSNQIAVNSAAGAGLEADFEIIRSLHIGLTGNVFAVREAERNSGYSILAGAGLSLSYMSVVGPLRIGIMHGLYKNEVHFNRVKGFINIGYSF